MNYTLNQLQIFLKVSQAQSVTKAAEQLHLTQPAVSIQLKNFQQQFDIPLTEVVGRSIFITDFGKEIAAAAEIILNEVEAINFKTMAHKGKLAGRLRLSIVSTGKYVMPYFLTAFMQKNNGVALHMDVTNKQKVLESLQSNDIDFSLVSVLPENIAIEKMALMQNKLYLVGNAKTGLKGKKNIQQILTDLPLIYRETGSGTRHTMERFIKEHNLPVSKKMELTSNEAIKQAILAGLGYSIMPLIGIKNELLNGDIKIIPVKGFPIITNWHLIWLKGKKFSPVAAAFLEYISAEKEGIVKEKFDWFENY
jgi:LysR family transcriptional regulator, low CO2-responsive transcriptional regulator